MLDYAAAYFDEGEVESALIFNYNKIIGCNLFGIFRGRSISIYTPASFIIVDFYLGRLDAHNFE